MSTPAPVWPAAVPAAVAHPVTMTATAEKLEPVAYEAPAQVMHEPEPMAEPVMEMMPETADLAYEMPVETLRAEPVAAAPAFQQEMEPTGESFPARPADNLQRPSIQVQASIQPPACSSPWPARPRRSRRSGVASACSNG